MTAYIAPFDGPGGLLNWLFGGGIGTNLGAGLIGAAAGTAVGVIVGRRIKAAWLRLHAKIDSHHAEVAAQVAGLHERHDEHAKRLAGIEERLVSVGERRQDLRGDPPAPPPSPASSPGEAQ